MLSTCISILGVLLTAVGTYVRVAPDLDRHRRRQFYSMAPFTRELFELRKRVKESNRGVRFEVEHKQVCKEFIDYTDAHDIREPPDDLPKSVKNVAADIEIELPNGYTKRYPQGTSSERVLVELLTQAIEKQCRKKGLGIAIVGAVLVIIANLI